MIKIEISYALPDQQFLEVFHVPQDCTVINAILLSNLLVKFPDIQLEENVGIFSKKVALNQSLKTGDRIEVYRPLKVNPNEARLLRKNVKSKSQP